MNKLFVVLFAVVLGCCTAELVADKKSLFLTSTANFGVDITTTLPVYVEVAFTSTISTYEVQFELDYSTSNIKKFSYMPEFDAVSGKILVNLNATEAAEPSSGSFRLPSATVLVAALSCLFLGASKTSRIVLVVAALMIAATVPAQAQVYELTLKVKMGNVLYNSFKGVKSNEVMSLSCPTAWTKSTTTTYGEKCDFACPSGKYSNAPLECASCGATCATCDSATTCSTCKTGFNKVGDQCVCPEGSYASGSTCEPCDPQCQECTAAGCTICRPKHADVMYPYTLDGGVCVCKAGEVDVYDGTPETLYGCDPCGENCADCTIDGCTTCEAPTLDCEPFAKLAPDYVDCGCPEGFVEDTACVGCFSCNIDPAVHLCIDCGLDGLCTQCHPKNLDAALAYVLTAGVCKCPDGYEDANLTYDSDWGCMAV